uniref:Uncharacterized protein n=1 Tax=Siphoviridae sp. ctL0q1 TaxID=2825449 RepID=A0A8S5PK17_9CAUD|nr:MAG TPA: hypothetical protein [Siphoviridae sp. ctL0q1]
MSVISKVYDIFSSFEAFATFLILLYFSIFF